MKDSTIIMLAGQGSSTQILYNALKSDFTIARVIIEEPVPTLHFLQRRIKKLGLGRVVGQILFQAIVVSWLQIRSKHRKMEIIDQFQLRTEPLDTALVTNVQSVNSDTAMQLLEEINPDIVIISGTRIISAKTLNCTSAKFINIHAGITPMYRGVHGGYWSLVENHKDLCGVTVHLVDPGIDTGSILAQGIIEPKEEDNFVTYPLLQLAKGLELLKRVLVDELEDRLHVQADPEGTSRLWSHPTILQYIGYRVRRGVR